jgi:hypothetical protein
MGNLLTYLESIKWENTELDRGRSIMQLNDAILQARKKEHSVYSHPDLYYLALSWGSFFNFLWNEGRDDSQRIARFPWLTQIQYDTLCKIFYSLGPPTNKPSRNLTELEDEFANNNNGLIGFEINPNLEKFVFNIESLCQWEIAYLKNHTEYIDWENCGHDYLPELKKTNELLDSEIKKYIKEEEIEKIRTKHNNDIGLIFYEEVMKKKSAEDRIAYAEELGGQIANLNYYQFDEKLTHNEEEYSHAKRRVYGIVKNVRKQYLSIDFEKGMFEVLNETGDHLGEFRFCGTKNKNADKDGGHDLWTLKGV